MFTNEPITGAMAEEWGWASESVAADKLEARTEEVARLIALTPTDLIMLTKRSINRQFEIMGFRTGMASSSEFLALSSLRPAFAREDEFNRRRNSEGLQAALRWREETFGNSY
jgi:enoyl-CoA hydratase